MVAATEGFKKEVWRPIASDSCVRLIKELSLLSKPGFRWIILSIIYLGMVSFAFAYHAIPPVLPLIIKEFGLSHAQGGLLMGSFALPGIVVSILAGMLSDRYGIKIVGTMALALMVLGALLTALSRDYRYLLLGRTIAGIGSMAISVNLLRLLALWFRKKDLGLAMGIYATSYPFGTLLSFNIFGFLGGACGWRAPAWMSFGTGALALFIFLWIAREPEEATKSLRAPLNLFMLVGLGLPIWLLALSWTFFESVIISFLTFAPDYFLGKGVRLGLASALPALIMPAHILLQPFVGWLLDRLHKRELFIGMGGLFMAVFMVVMAGDHESYVVPLIFFGIVSALVPAATFALTPVLVPPLYLGLAFGIISSLSNIGRVLMPYTVGVARDYGGDYRAGFLLMAILSLGVTFNIILMTFKRRNRES
jgi:MFS family permease